MWSKKFFLQIRGMQNDPHFAYFLAKFILEHVLYFPFVLQSVQNPWVREPVSKIPWVPRLMESMLMQPLSPI